MNRLQAYAQLVRLPNLPSALADIFLGLLVTGSLTRPERWPAYLLLMLASVGLYCGGMAWNDFFDLEQDRRERPDRPIPSGRITRFHAGVCAASLVTVGVLFALLSGVVQASRGEGNVVTPTVLALLLTGAVFLYDAWLKHTVIGPLGMGMCRFLNVLLGFTPKASLLWSCGLYLAFVVGLYIVGVTWLARTESAGEQPASVDRRRFGDVGESVDGTAVANAAVAGGSGGGRQLGVVSLFARGVGVFRRVSRRGRDSQSDAKSGAIGGQGAR